MIQLKAIARVQEMGGVKEDATKLAQMISKLAGIPVKPDRSMVARYILFKGQIPGKVNTPEFQANKKKARERLSTKLGRPKNFSLKSEDFQWRVRQPRTGNVIYVRIWQDGELTINVSVSTPEALKET